jgi:hypothetical protein
MAANSQHRVKVYFSASAFSAQPYPHHQHREAEKQLPGAEGGWGWFITLVPDGVLVV